MKITSESIIKMELKYNKQLYPKEAVIKAAYSFTDTYYIHIDADLNYYIINIIPKVSNNADDISKLFDNELLTQVARFYVANRTKTVRELILARAFASTVIEDQHREYETDTVENIDQILTDWFELYE